MDQLASGNLYGKLPGTSRRGKSGSMATTVLVFKDALEDTAHSMNATATQSNQRTTARFSGGGGKRWPMTRRHLRDSPPRPRSSGPGRGTIRVIVRLCGDP
jgi:hypothetical protein